MSDGDFSAPDLNVVGDDGPDDAPEHERNGDDDEFPPRYGAKGLFHPDHSTAALLRPSFFRPPNSAQSTVKAGESSQQGSKGIAETLATESTLSWLVRTSFSSSAGLVVLEDGKEKGKGKDKGGLEKKEEENIYERWWGSRAEPRPWSEKPQIRRRRTVPPEQEERWVRTREVSLSLHRLDRPFSVAMPCIIRIIRFYFFSLFLQISKTKFFVL